jgi:hypothetical protein
MPASQLHSHKSITGPDNSKYFGFKEITEIEVLKSGNIWRFLWLLSILAIFIWILLGWMIGIVLLTNSDEGVQVPEEMGHDGGERGVVICGPHACLAMCADRDGDGDVFKHSGFLKPAVPAYWFHCALRALNYLQKRRMDFGVWIVQVGEDEARAGLDRLGAMRRAHLGLCSSTLGARNKGAARMGHPGSIC